MGVAQARMDEPPAGLTVVDWAQIRALYEQHRHTATLEDDGSYVARNPRQGWSIRFDGRGFTVRPDDGDWTWGLELVSFGVEGAQQAIDGKAAILAKHGRVSYGWRPELEEWFVNDQHGLEHGWTLMQRPKGAGERLELELAVRGGLRPEVEGSDGSAVRFVDEAGAAVVRYAGLKAWDADGKALSSRMTASAEGRLTISVDDREARFPVTIDPVAVQTAYIKASNTGFDDWFGSSVAVSGSTVVAGAPFEDGNGAGVNSGAQADNSAGNSGAAYVFEHERGVWKQSAYLKASNAEALDNFGWSVAVSGNTLVVGAYGEDSNGVGLEQVAGGNNSSPESGAAYVFERAEGSWKQTAYLKPSNGESGDLFGWSTGVSGNSIVIGTCAEAGGGTGVDPSPASDNSSFRSGAAYVFELVGGSWTQTAYLKASNTDAEDYFGWSVAVSDDTLVVGAYGEDGNGVGVDPFTQANNSSRESGAAYIFERGSGTWIQTAYLKASNTGKDDNFGWSVAISGSTLVVGARLEDDSNNNSGAAYVFERSVGIWRQAAYLKASNSGPDDWFGVSVGVSDETLVVGAFEDSNGVGVNGSAGTDDSARDSGAAYLFERIGGGWAQTAYMKASNTGALDQFGWSVGISSNTIVVGARMEDSLGLGIDPNAQGDNSVLSGGAVYLFQSFSRAELGAFTNGAWFLDRDGDLAFDGASEISGWGSPGDTPVNGDWNGDGFRDLGVFSNGTWFLDRNGDAAFDPATEIQGWGAPGWIPVTGDWNGDGKTDIGAIDPATSTWFLDLNGDFAFDPATEIRGWGSPGDTPVVGDWDGDGDDDIGVFSGGTWFIDFNGDGGFQLATDQRGWGVAGWIPVVGDWDGDGADEIGAIEPTSMAWFRDVNGDFLFDPATELVGWGSPGDQPVVADWNGDGADDVGVFSGGTWFIDAAGDGAFDPATDIRGWGVAGWTPVPGAWQ